jgi:hypothetical protein
MTISDIIEILDSLSAVAQDILQILPELRTGEYTDTSCDIAPCTREKIIVALAKLPQIIH